MVVAKVDDSAELDSRPSSPSNEVGFKVGEQIDFEAFARDEGLQGCTGAPAKASGRFVKNRLTPMRALVGLVALSLVALAALPGAAVTDPGPDTNAATAETTSSTTEATTPAPTTSESTTPETTASTTSETTATTIAETTASTTAQTTATTAAETTATTQASSTTSTTASGPTTTSSAERQKIDAEAAQKAREVDAANANLVDLTNALVVLRRKVATQSAEVEIANQRLEAAQKLADATAEDVASLEAQVTELEYGLSDQAIRSFKGEVLDDAVLDMGQDPNEALRMQTMLAKATQTDIDFVTVLAGARDDLSALRADAENALALAAQSQQASEEQLAALEQDRLAQADLAASADDRLDHLLSERAALARLGADFDPGEDRSQTDALVAQLNQAPTPAPDSARAISNSASTQVTEADIAPAGNGIAVHVDIVENVRQLLIDAATAGVDLAGGGYRDSAGQIRARRANCGTSNYAIYEMRSSQCSPPTARPGRSMHEQGKAIDFTYNGKLIRSRSGAGWEWLNANANKYGLYNLPSEPWHWSVNGR